MPKKLISLNRRFLGVIRILAVIVGFGFTIHLTHRECSRNADQPIRKTWSRATAAPTTEYGKAAIKTHETEVFQATAYCDNGITRSGVPAAPGLVSADPEVIPLGSMIYVESPLMGGIYQVMDTGSAIQGKIIDIFIPSYEACINFGRRIVKVKVLRYGFNGKPPQENRASPSASHDKP